MLEVWAVIGAGNTRKSSTMRALTGAFGRKSCWELARPAGDGKIEVVKAFVDTTSPQERKEFLSPKAFVQVIRDAIREHGVTHALVCLRPTSGRQSNASSDHYLEAFKKQNWHEGGIIYHTKKDTEIPANELAERLRLRWKFV